MLELARAKVPDGHDIDGHSLVPLLSGKAGAHDAERPQWALSQGHMADNAISWFLLREGDMKLIVCKPDTLISSGMLFASLTPKHLRRWHREGEPAAALQHHGRSDGDLSLIHI